MIPIDTNVKGTSVGSKNVEANNPMNIVWSNDKWYGKIPKKASRFERFYHVDWGIRAGVRNLLRNYNGLTVKDFVHKYAPESGEGVPDVDKKYNNESNYARMIKKHTGLDLEDKVNLDNRDMVEKVTNAIMNMEDHIGYGKVKDRIPKGVELAFADTEGIARELAQYQFPNGDSLLGLKYYQDELQNDGMKLDEIRKTMRSTGTGPISTKDSKKLISYNGYYMYAYQDPKSPERVAFKLDRERTDPDKYEMVSKDEEGFSLEADGDRFTLLKRDFIDQLDKGFFKRV